MMTHAYRSELAVAHERIERLSQELATRAPVSRPTIVVQDHDVGMVVGALFSMLAAVPIVYFVLLYLAMSRVAD